MSSHSFMDFFTDKLLSYTSKMKGDTSRLTGSSNFMSDTNKLFSLNLLNGFLGDSSFNCETSNLIVPMKQSFGYNSGNNSFNSLHSFKPLTHLFNAFMMDPYHFSHSSETFVPAEKILVSHIMNCVCMSRPPDMNPRLNCGLIGKEMPLPSVNPGTQVSVNLALTNKKDKVSSKCNLPNFSTLNKELTNRKTREMNKRSRNRRRRRRKNQSDCNNAASPTNDTINKVAASSPNVYVVSENPLFECTVSVSHPLQIASSVLSSFIIPVDGASDDDSEWESYDMNQCDVLSNKSGGNNISTESSHIKSESEKCKSPQSSDCNFLKATSFKSSFVLPLGSSEDESDLDSSSADMLHNLTEFQFTGLFITNFCSPKTVSSKHEDSITVTDDEETIKTKALLREANKNWKEYAKEMSKNMKPKSQKVSFAPDDLLVEVFPADLCERKGEWEIYATERLRFKRKIDELEKIISPCLDPKHRSKVFKRLNKSVL